MFIDPVLDHIEKRVDETMWSYSELDGLTSEQLAAVMELVQSALTDTRKKFKNAVIGVCDE